MTSASTRDDCRIDDRPARRFAWGQRVDRRIHRIRADFYLRHLRPFVDRGRRLVDVGAGDGLLIDMLARVSGAESARGFDIEARQLGTFSVEVYDGRHLPLADSAAEVTICVTVLHHCGDVAGMLREIRRVTSKRFLLVEDRFDSYLDRMAVLGVHEYLRWVEAMSYSRVGFADTARWHELLAEAGFGVVGTQRLGVAVPWLPVTNILFICEPA